MAGGAVEMIKKDIIEDELIVDAIDLHAHVYPELSLSYHGRVTDGPWAEAAQNLKMGGFVMKSHLWPTMERAYLLQTQFPHLRIYGSITLNSNVGGLNPWTVESAIQLGAKVLWFPTWGARFDRQHHEGKYFRRFLPPLSKLPPENGIYLLDSSGQLKDEAKEILKMAQEADLVVGTGHISPAESLKVAEYCVKIGLGKLVFTHPISLGASSQEIGQLAELGCYIELTYLHVLLQVVKTSQLLEIIREVGYQKCLLTTDAFFSWTPPAPEMLRMYLGFLHFYGLEPEVIRQMVYQNPRKLLGIDQGEFDSGS